MQDSKKNRSNEKYFHSMAKLLDCEFSVTFI